MKSIQYGWQSARRYYDDPASVHKQQNFELYANRYDLYWAYYSNKMYDPLQGVYKEYCSRYGLYEGTRFLYNPARRLAEFYGAQVYPGVLSEDGSKLPEGVPLAIPFAEDTPDDIKRAIAQFWQWSNWQSKMSIVPTWGSALGSLMVEVIDDMDRGKVVADVIWPTHVIDLELDYSDNVKSYVIEHQAEDAQGVYMYRKEVLKDRILYYRDDRLEQAIENPYGFAPAVWVKHSDNGTDHGSPVFAGSITKIDELNSLVSHINDHLHQTMAAPQIIWSVGDLFGGVNQETNTANWDGSGKKRDTISVLQGPPNGKVDSLAAKLDLAASMPFVDKLSIEIEKEHPELTFFDQLRSMSQVTGPAVSRLIGDVSAKVLKASAGYDQSSIKLFQMILAIGGFRANTGGWGSDLTPQQEKFLPFNLDSYAKGKLDFAIMPRTLIKATTLEEAQSKQAYWNAVKAAVDVGVPLETVLRNDGWTEQQLATLGKDKADKIARDQLLAQDDVLEDGDAEVEQ